MCPLWVLDPKLKVEVVCDNKVQYRSQGHPSSQGHQWELVRIGSSELPLRHLWLPPAPGEAGAAQNSSMCPLESAKAGDDLGLGRDSTRPPKTPLSPQLVCLSKNPSELNQHTVIWWQKVCCSQTCTAWKQKLSLRRKTQKCDCSESMTAAPTNLWKKLWRQRLGRNKKSVLILAYQCLIYPSTTCLENCCLQSRATLCHLMKQLPKLLWL